MVLLKIALKTENVVCTFTVSSVFSDSLYLVFIVEANLPKVIHINGDEVNVMLFHEKLALRMN